MFLDTLYLYLWAPDWETQTTGYHAVGGATACNLFYLEEMMARNEVLKTLEIKIKYGLFVYQKKTPESEVMYYVVWKHRAAVIWNDKSVMSVTRNKTRRV